MGVFGSNVTLAVLIDVIEFHVDVLKGKKVCSEKPNHFWAKVGQNWPKSALPIMQSLRARARRRARGLIFFTILSKLKFHGGVPKKSSRSDQLLPSYLLKTISPLLMPILKFAAEHQ